MLDARVNMHDLYIIEIPNLLLLSNKLIIVLQIFLNLFIVQYRVLGLSLCKRSMLVIYYTFLTKAL